MRKGILIIACLLCTVAMSAQSVFDKFDGKDDVTTVVVTKKMFQMMGNVNSKESQEFIDLVKKLDNLKIFTTNSVARGKELKETAHSYMKSKSLEELMRVTENGNNVRIMVKTQGTETRVRELLMLVEGQAGKQETVVMTLTGDFDLNDVSALTDKMNLPGGKSLKKASKK